MTVLRQDLLAGRSIAGSGPLGDRLQQSLVRLGARVECFDSRLDDDDATAWARANAPLDALVYDGSTHFADDRHDDLLEALERVWAATRAIAAGALIPAGAGGRIVLIAPAADARPHGHAARAAFENMARTLSIEWARHTITTTMIAPGAGTEEAEIATLVGFLLSHAGGYLSGCRFELDGARSSS